MFEDLPLFRSTVKILKFCGFILDYNWRRYFCLLCCATQIVTQLLGMLLTRQSLDRAVSDAFILVVWCSVLLRATPIIINRSRYEELMEEIKNVYEDIEKNECFKVKQMLEKTSKVAKTMSTVITVFVSIAGAGLVTYPLFASSRILPFMAYIPGVDKYQTPWFQAVYVYQILITPIGSTMYLTFTNLIVSFIMFGELRCKILQCHLKNLKNLSRKEVYRAVVWCIRYHIDIMKYVKTINSLTSYIFLAEFLGSGALLCALMFLLNIVDSIEQSICVYFCFISILSQLLSVYYYADKLSDESIKIAIAGYDSNWLDFDLKSKKALLLLIAQAQEPCGIMLGNVYPMTLPMFQSLLNTSYSYFTLLRGFYK